MRTNLPLSSLEWDFWIQSRTKIYNDSKTEFDNYTKLLMDNILNIVKTENVSLEYVLTHLKKFWDESTKKRYTNMRKDRARFEKFKK